MPKIDFSNIEKYCLECETRLEIKINRDIERKKFCCNICKNRYNGRKRLEDESFRLLFISSGNSLESNSKKGHSKEKHSLWVEREKRYCNRCRVEYECRINSKRKYCSKNCCLYEIHENKKGVDLVQKVEHICQTCEKLFKRSINYKQSAKYCSRKCHCIGNYKNMKKEGTDIENIIESMLISESINYEKQVNINNISIVDFKVGNLLIYADGDYWHSLPKQIKKDHYQKMKLTSLGYRVVRFLGSMIKNDPIKVKEQIINEL